jgi:hypothetical protein
MIKAQEIAAVRLTLADGTEAVFVQEGAAWNKLTELRCVAPAALTGQIIITAPEAPAPRRHVAAVREDLRAAGCSRGGDGVPWNGRRA